MLKSSPVVKMVLFFLSSPKQSDVFQIIRKEAIPYCTITTRWKRVSLINHLQIWKKVFVVKALSCGKSAISMGGENISKSITQPWLFFHFLPPPKSSGRGRRRRPHEFSVRRRSAFLPFGPPLGVCQHRHLQTPVQVETFPAVFDHCSRCR